MYFWSDETGDSKTREREAREPCASRAEAWPGHGVMVETLPWRRAHEVP